ncbi:OLC1v1036927C1, partial [Oldenlandia corymbosa var. corymbosa]
VNAALQLIQLNGDSSSFSSKEGKDNGGLEKKRDEESVGKSIEISSALKNTMIEEDNFDVGEAFPPGNRKFRSILDIYNEMKPLSTNNKKDNKAAAA